MDNLTSIPVEGDIGNAFYSLLKKSLNFSNSISIFIINFIISLGIPLDETQMKVLMAIIYLIIGGVLLFKIARPIWKIIIIMLVIWFIGGFFI